MAEHYEGKGSTTQTLSSSLTDLTVMLETSLFEMRLLKTS